MRESELSWSRRLKANGLANFTGTFVIAGLNMAAMFAARLVVPMLALSMGASSTLVGATAAMFTAVPMFLSVSFGRWLDRSGTLLPIVFSTSLIILAANVFWIVPGKYTLLVVAGLIGTAGVFTHMAATRAVGGVGIASKRPRNLGYLVLSYSLFQFMGPMIAGASYQYFGAIAAITTIGGFSLLSITVVGLGFHYFKREKVGLGPRAVTRRTYQLLSLRSLRSWIFMSSAFIAAQSIYPFVVSIYAVEIGLPPIQAGWLLGAFAIGTFVSRFFTPLLTRYFRAGVTLVVALIMSAIIYALIPFVQDICSLSALSFGLALPLGIGVPVSLAMIYDSAPEGRVNESVGLSMTVNNLLQTLFPLILGMSVSRLGVAPMVLVFAVAMAAFAFITAGRSLRQIDRD